MQRTIIRKPNKLKLTRRSALKIESSFEKQRSKVGDEGIENTENSSGFFI